MTRPFSTHEVLNQPTPLGDIDLLTSDRALRTAIGDAAGPAELEQIAAFGVIAGSQSFQARGRLANEQVPKLHTHDAYGRRLDRLEYHPAYHELMGTSCKHGLHNAAWSDIAGGKGAPGCAHLARAAKLYMAAQADAGHCGPLSTTSAAIPILMQGPEECQAWLAKLLNRAYDASFLPIERKKAAMVGLAVSEKQAGRDASALLTQAAPVAKPGEGRDYVLVGHKWFVSAPMSDAFIVLAQAAGGPTAFLVPRHLPDGSVNAIAFRRLKSKLGLRSNACVELEFEGAVGSALGPEGQGALMIGDMEVFLHVDAAIVSAGLMRSAMTHAIHHCRERRIGDAMLSDQPIMRQVLAGLAVDAEAAVALAFKLARSFDDVANEHAAAWARLMTPVTRFWIGKIAPAFAAEAIECLGGNGTVEDFPLARIYRDLPALAVMSGSGNALTIDVIQILQQEPGVAELVLEELQSACGGDERDLRQQLARVEAMLHDPRKLDHHGRAFVELLAVLAAAVVLKSEAPDIVAQGFVASHIADAGRQAYGQGIDRQISAELVARAAPHLG